MAGGRRWGVWCCVFFVIFSVIRTELLHSDTLDRRPAVEFAQHRIVRPRIYHGRTKREITSSIAETEGGHLHDLTIGYVADGTDYVLDLQLNRDLVPKRYFERYQHDGRHVVNRPTGRDVQLCQYQGVIRDRSNSWAAVSTCNGLRGVIFDGEELHYLEPGSEEDHYLYKHTDLTTNQTCGYSGNSHHILENNEFNRILRYKRNSEIIRGPYNSNRQSRYVELVLVVDNKEYKEQRESLPAVYQRCKDIANIINALYTPLNIFIALVGVVVWTETDEISLSTNGDQTLTNFLHYRRERLVKEHPNDNAQLLTRVQFEGGVVGKALKGPICTFEFSGGVSMDHSEVVGLVATTVAHEMGHNLGMEHDTPECSCPTERCIMAPSSSSLSPTQWSSCSLDYLAVAFDHGMDYCLRNKPTSLFDSPVCGNGFVEAGEQCDCGRPDRCDNPCCNANTCMLFPNASCATGECCDLKTCRPKSAGSECRAAYHECDLPEYCTGQGEYCPDNVYKMDSETCDRGKAFCYQGSCRTHSDQCKLLWGPSGKSSDTLCYQMNTNGTRHGNCGFNKLNKSYIKCNNENIYCGMLHCRHLNERLEFGMESVSILSHSFINSGGSIIPCRTAIVDLGLNEVDPGLAPDGAKCGDGKMCVNQKCMAVGSLRQQAGMCPMDCNGNGVCNSRGHCHCKVGFSPPNCDYPGTGGSQDSGPASDPDAQRDVMTALYIIFLGIVPICALVAMFIYYARRRGSPWWKKTQLVSGNAPSVKPDRKSPPRRNGSATAIRTLEISAPVDNADASLLPTAPPLAANLIGQFKGFSITPISGVKSPTSPTSPPPYSSVVPTTSSSVVPPPPRMTTTTKLTKSNSTAVPNPRPPYLAKTNSMLTHTKPSFISSVNATSVSPALPPANANSHARPLISAPVLDTTTCTVKELSAVRNPTRPAPDVPTRVEVQEVEIAPQEVKKEEDSVEVKVKAGSSYPTLTRLASFMMKNKTGGKNKLEKSESLTKSQAGVKANKLQIDREALRNIQISNPIPQHDVTDIALEDLASAQQVVMRAQSMRDSSSTKRADVRSFGSMRATRPTSIPPNVRPTSPPPRPPPPPPQAAAVEPEQQTGIEGLPGYQNPPEYAYDDCLNLLTEGVAPLANIDEESPTSNDNIYAVIEESPPARSYATPRFGEYKTPKPIENSTSAGSVESVGLLSEIVSEIQARNVESIYSAGNKNASDDEGGSTSPDQSSGTYVNAANIYRPYSNMSNQKSSASSTSSSNGYLSPTKIKAAAVASGNANKPNQVGKSFPDKVPTSAAPALSSFTNSSLPTRPSPAVPSGKPVVPSKDAVKTAEPVAQTGYKPYSSSLHRSPGPFAASFRNDAVKPTTNVAAVHKPKEEPAVSLTAKSSAVENSTAKPLVLSVSQVSSILKAKVLADTQSKPVITAKSPATTLTKQLPSPSSARRDPIPPPQKSVTNSSLTNKPVLNRSTTPPSLNADKPTNPIKFPPSNLPKKSTSLRSPPSNSPDLVASCNTSNTINKSPDVLGKLPPGKLSKPTILVAKNNVIGRQAPPVPKQADKTEPRFGLQLPTAASKVVVGKSAFDVGKPAKVSHVASLQQKFETASAEKDKPVGNVTSRTLSNVAAIKKRPTPVVPGQSSSFKK